MLRIVTAKNPRSQSCEREKFKVGMICEKKLGFEPGIRERGSYG